MKRVSILAATAAAFVMAGSIAVTPASAQQRTQQPATIDGKPNLNGVWQAMNTANWNLEPHSAGPNPVADRQVGATGAIPAGLGVVEGGAIPYKPEALERLNQHRQHLINYDPEAACYLPGIPRATYMPFPFQIVQSHTKINMVFEFANAERTIHLTKMEPYPNVGFMGYSVGRWEGNALVATTDAFTDATWFDRAGNFHSDALKVVERFTPITRDAFQYEATMEDPQVFTKPWKITMPIYRRLEPNAQLVDFRCVPMVEETMYGHLRKDQLVKTWSGTTMTVDITRKIPPGEAVHERYISGNPPPTQ